MASVTLAIVQLVMDSVAVLDSVLQPAQATATNVTIKVVDIVT